MAVSPGTAVRYTFHYVAHRARRLFLFGEVQKSVYAVVRSGARSYRVEEGATITVDRRAGDAGDAVILDQVLLFADGVRVRAGTPFVSDAIVTAQIVGHGRGPKIRVFKYKNKTRSRKTRGHRQDETTLRITKIEA